ncbi:MAG: TAXI family TRAP transporter solute-binding subunit [Rhodospirillales bacterium]|nr:MAG: TAXI family TRAP transporter solute-binding subunit [Rhodospirillales bacterium]
MSGRTRCRTPGCRLIAVLVASVLAVLAGTAETRAEAERAYTLATATTAGTYYPVGVALATLTKVKLEPERHITMSAMTSAGSDENVRLLREDRAQFAILQGLFGAWAWTGTGALDDIGPQTDLRSISMLWQNVEHFTVHSEHVVDGTIADLAEMAGQRFAIGARGSGAEGSGRTILASIGIDPDAVLDLVYQDYAASIEALHDGTIAGMNTPGGVPVAAVTRGAAMLGDAIRVLDITDAQMIAANAGAGLDLWTRYVIPEGTYPGQSAEIRTIAQPNFLGVRADVDEDAVYWITRTIYENLSFLQAIHPATNDMAPERALAGLPFPLHPGALRYYLEQRLTVPDHLIAR